MIELNGETHCLLSQIGGKAMGLQKLKLSSFNVPMAFCVPVEVFDYYIQKLGLTTKIDSILSALNNNHIEQALIIAQSVQDCLKTINLENDLITQFDNLPQSDKGYAVRSSSVIEDGELFSWAGVFESDLFVKKHNIVASVIKCWMSLFSERAIHYMYKSGCTILFPKMAVVIQKMVSSSVSGVLFTQDILDGDTDSLIIEWCEGIGEKLVSGEITPNLLRINKKKVSDAFQLEKTSLPFDNQIMIAFLKDVLKLSHKMKMQLDVEWAYENGQIYVLQCRPITTVKQCEFGDSVQWKKDLYQLHLSRNMSFFHTRLLVEGHACKSELFCLKQGIHFLSVTQKGIHTRLYVLKEEESAYIKALIPVILSEDSFEQMKRQYKMLGDVLLRASSKCRRYLNSINFQAFCEAYKVYCAGLSLTVLAGQFLNHQLLTYLETNPIASIHPNKALSILTTVKQFSPSSEAKLELYQIGALLQSHQDIDMDQLSKKWVRKYQHIPVNFCENPWTTENYEKMLAEYLTIDCKQKILDIKSEKQQLLSYQKQLLKEINNPEVTLLVKRLQDLTLLNEYRKAIFCKTTLNMQKIFKKIARKQKLVSWKILYNLLPAEVAALIQNEKPSCFNRKTGVLLAEKKKVAELDSHSLIDISDETVFDKNKDCIQGIGISGKKMKGIVRVIGSSAEFSKMQTGDIIVTRMTSVDFVPLFEKAGGIITDEGGVTCHAAVISRELNKTCVIGTKIATSVLKDGDIVIIDAETGIVERVANCAELLV